VIPQAGGVRTAGSDALRFLRQRINCAVVEHVAARRRRRPWGWPPSSVRPAPAASSLDSRCPSRPARLRRTGRLVRRRGSAPAAARSCPLFADTRQAGPRRGSGRTRAYWASRHWGLTGPSHCPRTNGPTASPLSSTDPPLQALTGFSASLRQQVTFTTGTCCLSPTPGGGIPAAGGPDQAHRQLRDALADRLEVGVAATLPSRVICASLEHRDPPALGCAGTGPRLGLPLWCGPRLRSCTHGR